MSSYLLDVNVIVSHAILEHVHHRFVVEWFRHPSRKGFTYSVCPIVVSLQAVGLPKSPSNSGMHQ